MIKRSVSLIYVLIVWLLPVELNTSLSFVIDDILLLLSNASVSTKEYQDLECQIREF